VEVLVLSDIRGPAAMAQTLYRETDAAVNCASNYWKSAKRCTISKGNGKASLRSAIAARSGGCAAESKIPNGKLYATAGAQKKKSDSFVTSPLWY
jgi:hypothetical protein